MFCLLLLPWLLVLLFLCASHYLGNNLYNLLSRYAPIITEIYNIATLLRYNINLIKKVSYFHKHALILCVVSYHLVGIKCLGNLCHVSCLPELSFTIMWGLFWSLSAWFLGEDVVIQGRMTRFVRWCWNLLLSVSSYRAVASSARIGLPDSEVVHCSGVHWA